MYQVNLLPWRQRRNRRRAVLLILTLTLVMLLTGAAIGLLAFHWRGERADLTARLGQWQRQAQWEARQQLGIQRRTEQYRRLAHSLKIYRQTASDNRRFSRLLDQLPTLLPAGLWLTGLHQQDGNVVISGCCERYGDIVSLRRRLVDSALFTHLHWQEIGQRENGYFSFTFQAGWPRRHGAAHHG